MILIKIEIANHSGYCFGVKRAMEITQNALNDDPETIYAIGPIIHNDQAMLPLLEKGLIIEDDPQNMKKKSTAIIRSHGLPRQIYDTIGRREIAIIDATCPFVKKIQDIVFEASNNGYDVIIVGDPKHPEVIGINGWAIKGGTILQTNAEASEFTGDFSKKYICVVQTTFNQSRFESIKKILTEKNLNILFHNTICYATKQRQDAAAELSAKVDAMIVVGGKKSSNTLKLAEVCRANCPTFLIETYEDLDFEQIKDMNYIGIVAGASTPDFIIHQVYDNIVNKIKF